MKAEEHVEADRWFRNAPDRVRGSVWWCWCSVLPVTSVSCLFVLMCIKNVLYCDITYHWKCNGCITYFLLNHYCLITYLCMYLVFEINSRGNASFLGQTGWIYSNTYWPAYFLVSFRDRCSGFIICVLLSYHQFQLSEIIHSIFQMSRFVPYHVSSIFQGWCENFS
jgi:hypothetical protein